MTNKKSKINLNNKKIQRINYIHYILVFLFVFLIWGISISFDFSFLDDDKIILDDYSSILASSKLTGSFLKDSYLDIYYRPIVNLSFIIDAAIAGKLPYIYHLTNVTIHAFSICCLLYLFTFWNVENKKALVWTLIAASHPLLSNSIAWIPGRNDLILGLNFILGFIFFLKYVDNRKHISLIISSVFILFSFLSKETGLIIPLILLSYLLIFKQNEMFRYYQFFISTILIYIIYAFLRSNSNIDSAIAANIGITNICKNLFILPEIILKTLFPFILSPLPQFNLLISTAGFILFCVVLWFIFKNRYKSDFKYMLFGIIIFIISLVPGLISSYEKFGIDYFECRAYLPLFGILIACISIEKSEIKIYHNKYILIIALAIGVGATLNNISNYSSADSFYKKAVATSPESAIANFGYGVCFDNSKELNQAAKYYRKAIEIAPNYQQAYNNLGILLMKSKQLEESISLFKKALNISESSRQYYNLGLAFNNNNQKDSAIINFYKALALDSSNPDIYINLGSSLFFKNDLPNAMKAYQKAIGLDRKSVLAYKNLAVLYGKIGDTVNQLMNFRVAANLGSAEAQKWLEKRWYK
ncbi:MAG: tetratricopeptide repeat protein [Candidatus Kapabacteria bacterium]|nr:tetratricopeptide repeat protein [Candidatus Kapabacteria bacterium]